MIWSNYRREGRKFPWRETRDPYHILVSEFMLQQTQTERVLARYGTFLDRFPTVHALAAAELRDVLELWQGLGYNRRARFLHATARIIVAQHGGRLPSDTDVLETLPGIGPGTAGALAAFSYGRAVPFIETNIRRVFLHFFFPSREAVPDRDLFPLIRRTIDEENPREWYYALMDYGVYLRSQFPNANRRSAHYVRQSTFEGSNRQVRGAVVRELARRPTATVSELVRATGFAEDRILQSLSGLVRDGMVAEDPEEGGYRIP